MSNLYRLSAAQMERLKPFFPKSHGKPRVDDRRVLSGIIARDARVRIIRDSTVVGDYAIDTLKREKDDAKEVREGLECGIKIAGFNDIKEGDLLEAYRIEEIGRKFDS